MEIEDPADQFARDSKHYHDDGDIVIRHVYASRGPGAAAEGSCDGSPLVLEYYCAAEFRMVLKWMYSRPLALNVNPRATARLNEFSRARHRLAGRPDLRAGDNFQERSTMVGNLGGPVRKDVKYYHEDGDLVVRVESTLFNIHRFLLRESAVFQSVFSRPVGPEQLPDGLCEEFRLVLEGHTAQEFRAILKWMYSPPLELNIHCLPVSAIVDIVPLAAFAHKYELEMWKTWALAFLDLCVTEETFLMPTHFSLLHALYEQISDPQKRKTVMRLWVWSLVKALGTKSDIIDAIDAAETHGEKNHLANLYTLYIRRFCPTSSVTLLKPAALEINAGGGLAEIHVQRILTGHMSLALGWSSWRVSPGIKLPSPPSSANWAISDAAFNSAWLKAVEAAESTCPDTIDIPQRIFMMKHHLTESMTELIRTPYSHSHAGYKTVSPSSSLYIADVCAKLDGFRLADHFFC
ncbi:unnamed protein product [Mycena citricolor]|uniref:BTB domain-containing protein n=1 Tax=Mycena citricolor TaxID=2018698 RepID=A0AAD2HWU9_9AGAR|nr:unnamed protein product [Mycena citricolor]